MSRSQSRDTTEANEMPTLDDLLHHARPTMLASMYAELTDTFDNDHSDDETLTALIQTIADYHYAITGEELNRAPLETAESVEA
jgi:hypothetical protein